MKGGIHRTWASTNPKNLDFNCDFQIEIKIWQSEIGNLDRGKFKNIEKIGNLGRTFREKRLEIWKKYRNLGKLS